MTQPPARNRISPAGDIIAAPGRGAWMGNRGRLHRGHGSRDIVRDYQSTAWLTCALSFKGRRLTQWEPNRYTLLFALDEAVALAAGHRPCALCRRGDYKRYRQRWADIHGGDIPSAAQIDAQLHSERTTTAPHLAPWTTLPDGAFVRTDDGPALVVADHLALWDAGDNQYRGRLPRPLRGHVDVLTPPSTVEVLRAGYPVQIDPAARHDSGADITAPATPDRDGADIQTQKNLHR